MNFTFSPASEIPEVIVIQGCRFSDERGFFSETFRVKDFESMGLPPFVQENMSRSSPYCLRGFHYQLKPMEQGKLVSCPVGKIVDIAVDIRVGSPTYSKYIAVELSQDENKMLYIPAGFAHGFITRGNSDAIVTYKVTNYYSPQHDRSVKWDDPDIGIDFDWLAPELIKVSAKDRRASLLKYAENNFIY